MVKMTPPRTGGPLSETFTTVGSTLEDSIVHNAQTTQEDHLHGARQAAHLAGPFAVKCLRRPYAQTFKVASASFIHAHVVHHYQQPRCARALLPNHIYALQPMTLMADVRYYAH